MRIATLQFNPHLGALPFNISRADALLSTLSNPDNNPNTTNSPALDLLVLPELAFTGYNFTSLAAITPYLEPTTSGPTTLWAIATAKRLGCHVIVGYPERCAEDGRNFNSTVTVSSEGEVLLNYRKSFLYYTDETWASEGPAGSAAEGKGECNPFFNGRLGDLGMVGHGICMDINPYKFTEPWSKYEFATSMMEHQTPLIVLSMAWLTRLLPAEVMAEAETPDMETVAYWLERFYPLLATEEDVTVVFANRCGTEGNETRSVEVENGQTVGVGDEVCYAGSSCVMQFGARGVRIFERGEGPGILGKGEEGLLVVDTGKPARYLLQSRAR